MEVHRNENESFHGDDDKPALVSKSMTLYARNGLLHRSNGPACISRWGTKQYYWKGVQIEQDLWDACPTMSIEDVIAVPNAEVRRCLIEKIGYEEFFKRAGKRLNVLNKDADSGAVLYSVDVPDDEPVTVVRVIDGTPVADENGNLYAREYFLRVPPDMKTARQAIAWTFRMTVEEYHPEVET